MFQYLLWQVFHVSVKRIIYVSLGVVSRAALFRAY